MYYFLNIGSNLGNRKLNISRALRAIEAKFGYFETSKIVESEPWGYDSTNSFLNIGVMVISDESPLEVLHTIKEIEKSIDSASHRTPEGGYADRVIDIDIMAIDEMDIKNEELTVPHKDLSEREFFLLPLSELAPAWKHPRTGLTPDEMLFALKTRKEED